MVASLKRISVLFLMTGVMHFLSADAYCIAQRAGNADPVTYVNPLIGTSGSGHTFPGATVPFGMVQLSPDNGRSGWDWCSGYHYRDDVISGFTHTHLSGTDFGDLNDILFMPTTGVVPFVGDVIDFPRRDLRSKFSHENEGASPGYYRVMLTDYNIDVELTATQRCGIHRYTFPRSDDAVILIDLGFAINSDQPVETRIDIENDSTVSGYRYTSGYANDQKIFFIAKFSQPFKKFAVGVGRTIGVGNRSLTGINAKAMLLYSTSPNSPIVVKVGLSSVNRDGALRNLQQEAPGWDFDRIRAAASASWSKELSKIKIETPNEAAKRVFYTALYHTLIAPNVYSDVDGKYRGADGQIHTAQGYTQYSVFSFWDTFRAEHPLLTILNKERVSDMLQSIFAIARESGTLPLWPLAGNDANLTVGYHVVSVIVEAYLKGIRSFNADEAFQMMKKKATLPGSDMDQYIQNGYVAADKEVGSVAKTLDYAFDDWCIAQMAKTLGNGADYTEFLRRAGNYKNVYNSGTGFMRGKNSDGSWRDGFDPRFSNNGNDEFLAANAWEYSWFVPQDFRGLITLMGGDGSFVDKLDQLFEMDPVVGGDNVSPEITGLIGLYAQGTSVCHHVAYLYNYAKEPWKTQQHVREIIDNLYHDTPDGLPGNDNCGQLSAWYVFSSLGLYPVNPVEGAYVFGSPTFESATIDTGEPKPFIITAHNVSSTNKYIQSANLNGSPLTRLYVTHNEILQGSALEFDMGGSPNTAWGTGDTAVPPTDMR